MAISRVSSRLKGATTSSASVPSEKSVGSTSRPECLPESEKPAEPAEPAAEAASGTEAGEVALAEWEAPECADRDASVSVGALVSLESVAK